MQVSKQLVITTVSIILLGLSVGLGVVLAQQVTQDTRVVDEAQAQEATTGDAIQNDDNDDDGDGVELEDDDGENESEVEDDDGDNSQAALREQAGLTSVEAMKIAEDAVDGAQAQEVELEKESGAVVYEIEMSNGAEVAIDANSGSVLEIEQNDDDNDSGDDD